jgi:hypothetical protein
MSKHYYCNNSTESLGDLKSMPNMHEWSFWNQAGMMMTVTFVVGALSFILSYYIHKLKLWNAKAFNPAKVAEKAMPRKETVKTQRKISMTKNTQLQEGLINRQATVNDSSEYK